MKNIKQIFIPLFVFFMSNAINAQTSIYKNFVEIKTSAVCGSCKATIEQAVNAVEGVISASLDVKSKVVTVVYDADKTSFENIKHAITASGYDADELTADPEAYDHLDGCCKKE